MRLTLPLCRNALAGAAAFVLLTACGGGDSTDASSSSSSAGVTGENADSPFCRQAQALVSDVQNSFTQSTDPAALPQALQKAADGIRSIDAPPEIASDWKALADGLEQLAQGYASTNFNDPAQAQKFQQDATALEAQLGQSSTNVEKYLSEQCGITDETGSSSPTS